MDELRERAKGYIQMEEMSKFRNEVRQAKQKCDMRRKHQDRLTHVGHEAQPRQAPTSSKRA